MDLKKFLEENKLNSSPSGLSGCRTSHFHYDSCDYDVTIFDNSVYEKVYEFENELVFVHPGKLDETKSGILIHYDEMEIINDESWDLQMFLAVIQKKKSKIFKNFAKNCFIEALFCCQNVKDGIKSFNDFSSCWQKCASIILGDGICALNGFPPSSHSLEHLRQTEKNSLNQKISVINETIGIERATLPLLERMFKSTIGFSDMVEKNNYSKIIEKKFQYFVNNSMFSDCYYYLCHVNKENFIKIKGTIHRKPELIHILKVAFDLERDPSFLIQQSDKVQQATNDILKTLPSS